MATMQGASDEEIAEVAFLTSYRARWSAMLHALQYDYETLADEVHKIGKLCTENGQEEKINRQNLKGLKSPTRITSCFLIF